jgi:hypothetical protein
MAKFFFLGTLLALHQQGDALLSHMVLALHQEGDVLL